MFVDRHRPPYKTAGAVFLVVLAVIAALIYLQFRGHFARRTQLTLHSSRTGLVVDPGSKVTYNGVEIGRVARIGMIDADGTPKAELTLEVEPRYLGFIPANVSADIKATTVFGNKYVSFSSPENPSAQRISASGVIDVSSVTTEFNTLFETVTSIAEEVDPVKLNQTLTATAEALTGLGDRFGGSLVDGNRILDDLNPRMPQLSYDIQRVAELRRLCRRVAGSVGRSGRRGDPRPHPERAARRPRHGVTGRGWVRRHRRRQHRALCPISGPGPADLVPTAKLLDDYRGMIFCTIRNYHDVGPRVYATLGGNGYSPASAGTLIGAGNPYIYPDNLPRISARGGPVGRPGCCQKITRELWPMPYLVMDTGYSIAPYNHAELGQPLAIDYVWGRQIGELTINP